MERKGQRTIRRQRRSRSWLFSPMIIAQLAVVMIVAGVGVAFALPTGTPTQTAAPWIGTSTITDGVLAVQSYDFGFNADYSLVTTVTLNIKNTSGSDDSGTVEVTILGIKYTATVDTIGAGLTAPTVVTLGSGIAVDDVSGPMYVVVKN